MPIHQRLKNDFMKTKRKGTRKNNNAMVIELFKQTPSDKSFVEPSFNENFLPSNMYNKLLIPLINSTRKMRRRKSKKNYVIKYIKTPKSNTKNKRNYKYLVTI